MNQTQLRREIIRPTLIELGLFSPAAENLLMGTAAVESKGGHFIKQYPSGPALGIYQMETATHDDIIENHLRHKKRLRRKVEEVIGGKSMEARRLVYDARYATVFCRLHYLRVPQRLPQVRDVEAMGEYWKRYYNTRLGKGTVDKYVKAWYRTVEPRQI